jgi:hypothetical protein
LKGITRLRKYVQTPTFLQVIIKWKVPVTPQSCLKRSLAKIESNKAVEFTILREVEEGADYGLKHSRCKLYPQVNAVHQKLTQHSQRKILYWDGRQLRSDGV